MKTLGQTLKDARIIRALTLKQVEEITGISNAYLSQLENDKIKKPSANVLYKLASVYSITLEVLLSAAGIINEMEASTSKLLNSVALSAEKLDPDEEQALLDYLKYIRFNKKNA